MPYFYTERTIWVVFIWKLFDKENTSVFLWGWRYLVGVFVVNLYIYFFKWSSQYKKWHFLIGGPTLRFIGMAQKANPLLWKLFLSNSKNNAAILSISTKFWATWSMTKSSKPWNTNQMCISRVWVPPITRKIKKILPMLLSLKMPPMGAFCSFGKNVS